MTYNATNRILSPLVSTGVLQELTFPEVAVRRSLFVTPEIHGFFNESSGGSFNLYELKKVLKFYLAGHLVTVCCDGRREARSDFKRIRDLTEVWALSSRRPKFDQYRLLGRFFARDVFVGLALLKRSELGDRKSYHLQASKIIDHWNVIFPQHEPLSGIKAADYFGGVFNDIDKF